MSKLTVLFLGLSVMAVGACRDTAGLDDNASAADRQEVLAALDGSGFAGEDFGSTDPESNFSSAAAASAEWASASTAGVVTLPAFWGIRHGGPTVRNRTVHIENDTASVHVVLEFGNGQFSMIVPQSGAPALTVNKPAAVTMTQNAVLVKNEAVDASDTTGLRSHKWKIVRVSPQNWQMKDEAKRTTKVNRVQVLVNGATKIDITDPAQLYDVNNKMPRLVRGDVVQVIADVGNTAATGNTPPTFVFLNVRHTDPTGVFWRRLQMQDLGGGSFQVSWVVRLAGRDRLVVNALDSQTFQTETGTEARGNAWAVPYRIE